MSNSKEFLLQLFDKEEEKLIADFIENGLTNEAVIQKIVESLSEKTK